jgi:hypothetical protein
MPKLPSTPWSLVASLTTGVLSVGVLAELVAGPLRHISQGFFVACGTAALLLVLAVFVEITPVMGPVIEAEGLTRANEMTVRALARVNAAMFVIAEAAALYAIAVRASSVFLVVCCVLPCLVQLSLMVQTVYYRTGVSRVGPG